jgi:hypothetical protein
VTNPDQGNPGESEQTPPVKTELVTSVSDITAPPRSPAALISTFSEQMLQSENVHVNVKQQLIVTTEDKLMLCLTKFTDNAEKRGGWIAPLGILVSLLLTLATATFRDIIGISQYTWKALFIMAVILSGAWLIWSLKNRARAVSCQDVVNEIKKGSFKT